MSDELQLSLCVASGGTRSQTHSAQWMVSNVNIIGHSDGSFH